jgi:predicted transposase YbfD/YdcC
MDEQPFTSLEMCFSDLTEPRVQGRCDHKLVDIVLVAICATLCGAKNWCEVEEFAEAKITWLRQYLELPAGIPSHDTFSRVFRLLDAAEFQERFMRWVALYFEVPSGQVIAVDGKTARGSYDAMSGQSAIHLVSAWASETGVLLGQRKVDEKSNEITVVPELLEQINIKGCIVTVDALNCQKEIATKIIERGGDYVLSLKKNHPLLHQEVVDWFEWAQARQFRDVPSDFHQTMNKGHGRLETRRCWVIHDPRALQQMGYDTSWAGLQSVALVERTRHSQDKHQHELAYYLTSLGANARRLLNATRAHWSVENNFHWTMDVVFGEDATRVRMEEGAENMAIIRHIALNLLKRHPLKRSISRKQLRAALDDAFLLELLTQF